jgi:hypothetical protein
MKSVLVVENKAKNVFKYLELVSKTKGHLTLKDLKQASK